METLRENLPLIVVGLIACVFLWVGGALVLSIFLRLKRGKPIFPKPPASTTFLETWTSARNLSAKSTRRRGAVNCLIVALTADRFRLGPHFPFNLLFMPEQLKLELDLPHRDVLEVTETIEKHGITAHLRFLNQDRQEETIELLLRNQQGFMMAARRANLGGVALVPPQLDRDAINQAAMLPLNQAFKRYWTARF